MRGVVHTAISKATHTHTHTHTHSFAMHTPARFFASPIEASGIVSARTRPTSGLSVSKPTDVKTSRCMAWGCDAAEDLTKRPLLTS